MPSAGLASVREALRALTASPGELPAGALATARRHVEDIEQALERSRNVPAELAVARRTLETLEQARADHWHHLHDLTGRPGYRALDALAHRVRRHKAPAVPSHASALAPADDAQPPIAVAVVETRELLTAAAQIHMDDPVLGPVAERALAELAGVTPELTTGQSLERELAALAVRLDESRTRLADVQHEVHAVRRRRSSRLLDLLRLPPRARSSPPQMPVPQGDSGPNGWPHLRAGNGHDDVLAHLDLPEAPAVVLEGETLVLAGWAFTAQDPVSRVEVTLDGIAAGAARLGDVRTDVYGHYQIPHALLSGFEFRADPAALRGRRCVEVVVTATTRAGRRVVIATRDVWVARALDRPIDVDSAAGLALATTTHRSPKLLVFTHDLGFGGGQLWLVELLDRMGAGRDFPCTVVVPRSGPLAPPLRRLGIAVHVSGAVPTDRADAYEGRLREIASWLAPQGFTSVLVNTFLSFAGADVATRLGIPCVWAIHESWTPDVFWSVAYPPGSIDRQVRYAAMRALAASGAVVFEADATRALYAAATRPGAAMVVRYGVRTLAIRDYSAATDRAAARKALGLTGFDRILLMMGTVEPRKGQTLLALAFARIAEAHPDTTLIFVGAGDTPYVRGLNDYLQLSGLNQQVRVQPLVADSNPWYCAADALVCASDVESMPRSVLEAMAFGLPVLSAAVFGLPELITDGETGLLFEGSDVNAAAAGLERLLTMGPDALQAIAAAGRRHVVEHYDSAGYSERIRRLLYEGLDESVASGM